jgi:hypothetical protein
MATQFRRGESAVEQRIVTMKLRSPTVFEAWNAMSRSAGSLSWRVSYVSARAAAIGATVALVEPDQEYGLYPRRAYRIDTPAPNTSRRILGLAVRPAVAASALIE